MERTQADLELALGHRFARPDLLVRALTHRSLANQLSVEAGADESAGTVDNERLEFLGDAVVGLVVAEALFLLHPDWQEGELTRMRAHLVSRKHMGEVARAFGLAPHIRLSRGEERSGLRNKANVLSNTMEAVLGALFLDGGVDPVREFARRWVIDQAAEEAATELRSWAALGNYKAALQEHLQATHTGTPAYRVKSESGPDNHKRFQVEVRVRVGEGEPGKALARGMGTSKKLAEQDAARRALERLAAAREKSGHPGLGGSDGDREESEVS